MNKEILFKSKVQGIQMVEALTQQEWDAIKYLRQHYFFNLINIQDPYTWTFTDEAHRHIVLIKGAEVIGYAHIQLWPDKRAALRIIVIETEYRNQGIGSEFLTKCEHWLHQMGVLSLHIESSPQAYAFYKKAGYEEMPFNDPDGYEKDPRDIEMGKRL